MFDSRGPVFKLGVIDKLLIVGIWVQIYFEDFD